MASLAKQKRPSDPPNKEPAARSRAAPVEIDVDNLDPGKLLPERIYEELLGQIATGRFARGDRLPSENALAHSFGVSRPTIRNALSRLQADGIVRTRKGSGNYVAETPSTHLLTLGPGSGNISDMLLGVEFRIAIEGDAAALAAHRRTDVELAEINEIIKRQERSSNAPLSEVHDADIAFHTLIADAARNRLFSEAIRELYGSVMNSWLLWRRISDDQYNRIWRSVLKEHRAVYEAIRIGNADAARMAMRDHLTRGRQRMLNASDT
jgi:GntR family transcriptional regulator, transcriptional repressor for pyruvate dehydrogenase complex